MKVVALLVIAALAVLAQSPCDQFNFSGFLIDCYGCENTAGCEICTENFIPRCSATTGGSCTGTVTTECTCGQYGQSCYACLVNSTKCNFCDAGAGSYCADAGGFCTGTLQNDTANCPNPCVASGSSDVCTLPAEIQGGPYETACLAINSQSFNGTNCTDPCTSAVTPACGLALLNYGCSAACAPCTPAIYPTQLACKSICDSIVSDCDALITAGCFNTTNLRCAPDNSNCADVAVNTPPTDPCAQTTTGSGSTTTGGVTTVASTTAATTAASTGAGTTGAGTTGAGTTGAGTTGAGTTGGSTTGGSTTGAAGLVISAVLIIAALCLVF